ncbi:hypothetical protein KW791_02475 [Candidatus Parcubacteria bacterium]|nr:hypothetical protein [Candidatus Parcubacteria bacterium]
MIKKILTFSVFVVLALASITISAVSDSDPPATCPPGTIPVGMTNSIPGTIICATPTPVPTPTSAPTPTPIARPTPSGTPNPVSTPVPTFKAEPGPIAITPKPSCPLTEVGGIVVHVCPPTPTPVPVGPISIPPPDTITSSDGNVTVGVSQRYGGAIVYYKDKRISDTGNIVNAAQGGALFNTATLWTLPLDTNETKLCFESQKINGTCPGTIGFNNPTQGGYLGYGYAGNPNPTAVVVNNNQIHVSFRYVNYNYDYAEKPLTVENKKDWQTDFWGDTRMYFHPYLPDVLVVESKVTYCKDMDPSCKDKKITTEDVQLGTFFAANQAEPDPRFKGPYTRSTKNDLENWAAVLQQSKDLGLGLSVEGNTTPYIVQDGLINLARPNLKDFKSSGVVTVGPVANHWFEFSPGGWLGFTIYSATGSTSKIGWDLVRTQDSAFSNPPMPIASEINGSIDALSCSGISGWARDTRDLNKKVVIRAEITEEKGTTKTIRSIIADLVRPDLGGLCKDGACAFSLPLDLPDELYAKDLKINLYGESQGAQNRIFYANSNPLKCYKGNLPVAALGSAVNYYDSSKYDLAWKVQNATSISIDNGIGSVPLIGDKTVQVPNGTTFTLTATNNSGSVTVTSVTKSSTRFSIGMRLVTVSGTTVKESPSFFANNLGTQPVLSRGVIVAGPVFDFSSGDRIIYWKMDFDTGVDGWVREDSLYNDFKVIVSAKGTPALGVYPVMKLMVGNKLLKEWTVTGDYQDYYYDGPQPIDNNVKIVFPNDFYNGKEDRNLIVDFVLVKGVKYESESPTTLVSGYWSSSTGCAKAFKKVETIQCNQGSFEYPNHHKIILSNLQKARQVLTYELGNIFSIFKR